MCDGPKRFLLFSLLLFDAFSPRSGGYDLDSELAESREFFRVRDRVHCGVYSCMYEFGVAASHAAVSIIPAMLYLDGVID